MALAEDRTVNSTYSPAARSFTHFCPEDSISTRKGPYFGPSTIPVVFISSASYVVQGISAPTRARANCEKLASARTSSGRRKKDFISELCWSALHQKTVYEQLLIKEMNGEFLPADFST